MTLGPLLVTGWSTQGTSRQPPTGSFVNEFHVITSKKVNSSATSLTSSKDQFASFQLQIHRCNIRLSNNLSFSGQASHRYCTNSPIVKSSVKSALAQNQTTRKFCGRGLPSQPIGRSYDSSQSTTASTATALPVFILPLASDRHFNSGKWHLNAAHQSSLALKK